MFKQMICALKTSFFPKQLTILLYTCALNNLTHVLMSLPWQPHGVMFLPFCAIA